MVLLDLWDANDLRQLSHIDGLQRCPACGTRQTAAEAYVLRDSRAVLSPADVCVPAGRADLLRAAVAVLGPEAPPPRRARSIEIFRRNVVSRRAGALRVARDFLGGRDSRLTRRGLLSIDAPSQLIIGALVDGDLKGGDRLLGVPDPQRVADLRKAVLIALIDLPLDASLDRDVRRILAPAFVQPADVAFLESLIARRDADKQHPLHRYALAAVHALACLYSGVTNTHAGTWATLYCHVEATIRHGADELLPFRLSPDLVRETLRYQDLWDFYMRSQLDRPPYAAVLPELLRDLNHHQVVADVLRDGIRPQLTTRSPEWLADRLDVDLGDEVALHALTRMVFRQLAAERRPTDLERFLDLMIEKVKGDPERTAILLARFGEACKEGDYPAIAIKRLGAQAAPDESRLSREAQADLAVERSNALRLLGHNREALAVLDALLPIVTNEGRATVQHNRAILLRTLGWPDRSAAMLRELLTDAVGGRRLAILESLAVSYDELGRFADAADARREALPLAAGPWAHRAVALQSVLPGEDGQPGEVDAVMSMGIPDQDEMLAMVLIQWIKVIGRADEAGRAAAQEVVRAAVSRIHSAVDANNLLTAIRLARHSAFLSELLGGTDAAEQWQLEVDLRTQAADPDPFALLSVAALRLAEGDAETARSRLVGVAEAMSAKYGAVADAGVLVGRTAEQQQRLWDMADAAVEQDADASLLRLIADLQRDATGRAMLGRRVDGPTRDVALLRGGLPDEVIARLARPKGELYVLEWLDHEKSYRTMLTSISPDGTVRPYDTPSLHVRLGPLVARLRERLDAWPPDGPGDPLDLKEWRIAEDWLRALIPAAENERPHVVIIDHAEHHGLPWHAVRKAHWTTSYAPSWSSLLVTPTIDRRRLTRVGLVTVPTHRESTRTLEAFTAARRQLEDVCTRTGRTLTALANSDADSAAVAELLSGVDIAVMLCHGFRTADASDIAFILAHDGRLPTVHTVAAASAASRGARWSWRDSMRLPRAPAVLLSAGCSTGSAHIRGLGERLGMFGALRLGGTAAVVAPAWDAVAADSCRMVIDVLDGFLDGAPLPEAVEGAGERIRAGGRPRWRSVNLMTEGSWK
ncbi:hypothetical protein [Micromonospora sp. NPDC049662]|uniref:hypothetical protein n=1 Tax=Micromonospora sp. NPDC049662 TaxID=3155397 RepID=UPI00341A844A